MFFLLGTCVSQRIRLYFHKKRYLHWRQFDLLLEILLLIPIPWISDNRLANMVMAFSSSLQFHAFRKVRGKGFTTMACTGAYRGLAENLTSLLVTRNIARLSNMITYGLIVLFFFTGVGFGVTMNFFFDLYAVWGCLLLLIPSFLMMALPV